MFWLLLWLASYHPGDTAVVEIPGLPENVVNLTGRLVSQCDREYTIAPTEARRVGGKYQLSFGIPSTAAACKYELVSVDYQLEGSDLEFPDSHVVEPPVVVEVR